MALNIKPGTKFPFTIGIVDESSLGGNHTWDTVADWCTLLIGPIDEWWSLEFQDGQMVWGFKRKDDAGLFRFTWEEKPKKDTKTS